MVDWFMTPNHINHKLFNMSKKIILVNDVKKACPKLDDEQAVMIANFLLSLSEVAHLNSPKSNPSKKAA